MKPKVIKKLLFTILCLLSFSTMTGKDRARVTLQTTEGDIVLELYDETPLHRDNFIKKMKDGFFTGKRFDRVIRNFMIQCGEEQTEHNLPAEIHYPKYFHKRGALAMGRSGDDPQHKLESNAEQFYIVWGKDSMNEASLHRSDSLMQARSYGAEKMTRKMRRYYLKHPGTPFLDGSYTVFGEMVEGMDILDRIQSTRTNNHDKPLQPITIVSVKVDDPESVTQGNEFTIRIDDMQPMRFPSRTVSYGFSLTLRNDSVEMYLPYMGEVYQPEFNNEGLNMTVPIYAFASSMGKKGRRDISFRCKRGFVEYQFRITLYPEGKSYIHLIPSNAQSISYSGEIDDTQTK